MGTYFTHTVIFLTSGTLIRPEVRYDRALTDQFKPFEQNTSRDQWTLALDVILEF